MPLSEEALSKLFPQGEPAFSPPFYVDADKHGEVHIYDANDALLATFCRYTQMPLGDDNALEAEVAYWQAEAKRLIFALNSSYPT